MQEVNIKVEVNNEEAFERYSDPSKYSGVKEEINHDAFPEDPADDPNVCLDCQ